MTPTKTTLAWPGVPFALLSAILFGASTPMAKLLLGSGVGPWFLAGLLYFSSGIGLAAVLTLRRVMGMAAKEAPLRRTDIPWLLLVVISGGVVAPVLLLVGLSGTAASTAALLLNLEGLATMVIAWVVFRENADTRILIGAAAILAGAAVLSYQGGPGAIGWGSLAIAGACIAWAIDNNVTRKISAVDPIHIAMIKGLFAGAVNLAIGFASQTTFPKPEFILAAGLVGFLGYGISLVLFVLALRHLGAARTGAYFATAPFVGASIAVIALAEPLTMRLIAAGLLMAIGIYLHLTENHEHRHRHGWEKHDHRHTHDPHHQHAHESGSLPTEPHAHPHEHEPMVHEHPHYPDPHHQHVHDKPASADA